MKKGNIGKLLAVILVLCAIVAPAILFSAARTAAQEEGMRQKALISDLKADLVYKKAGDQEITLDLMLPKTTMDKEGNVLFPNGTPVVFYFHGGGWRNGTRYVSPSDAKFFSENGMALVCVTYRLAKGNGVTVVDCITDCFDSARYIMKVAPKYNLDVSAMFSYGHSAGGHLTLMMLMADSNQFPGDPELANYKVRFAGGVASAPPTTLVDLAAWNNRGWNKSDANFKGAFGGSREEKYELAKKASPYYWLGKESSRTLIIHGDEDPVVDITQSIWMETKARELGADLTLWRIPGASHSYAGSRCPLLSGMRTQIMLGNLLKMAREKTQKAK